MSDYNPKDYINDYSWVGDIGNALSSVALKAPDLIKLNKAIHENNMFKDQTYQSVNSFIDGLDENDATSIARAMNLKDDSGNMVNARDLIKKAIPVTQSEETTNQEYGAQLANGFFVPLVQAASKTGISMGKLMQSQLTGNITANLNESVEGKKYAEEQAYNLEQKRSDEQFAKEVGTEDQPGRIAQRTIATSDAEGEAQLRHDQKMQPVKDKFMADIRIPSVWNHLVSVYTPDKIEPVEGELDAIINEIEDNIGYSGKKKLRDSQRKEIKAYAYDALNKYREALEKNKELEAKKLAKIQEKEDKEAEPKSISPLETRLASATKAASDAEGKYRTLLTQLSTDNKNAANNVQIKRAKEDAFIAEKQRRTLELAYNRLLETSPTGEVSNADINEAILYGKKQSDSDMNSKMVQDVMQNLEDVRSGKKTVDRLKKEMDPKFKEYAGYNFDDFFEVSNEEIPSIPGEKVPTTTGITDTTIPKKTKQTLKFKDKWIPYYNSLTGTQQPTNKDNTSGDKTKLYDTPEKRAEAVKKILGQNLSKIMANVRATPGYENLDDASVMEKIFATPSIKATLGIK